jgi:hypothetical protein
VVKIRIADVTLDFDDTVITLHANQEGGEVGYNPRYRGRPSFKAKVCFIGSSDELLHFDLYGGKTHSNKDFLAFFQTCLDMLPNNYVVRWLRLDKSFFDEDNFKTFESNYLEYVCKTPLHNNLKKAITLIPQEDWDEVNEYTDVTSRNFILPGSEKPRRFVIRRVKKVKIQVNGSFLFQSAIDMKLLLLTWKQTQPKSWNPMMVVPMLKTK